MRQATSYSCGAAVMLSVLYYWNAFDGAESDLYADLKTTPGYGTDSRNMASAAPRWGLSATLREGMTLVDLEAALAKGDTVIIDLQAWPKKKQPGPRWEQLWEDGHYVVLVAMDSRYVYVMDPAVRAGYAYIPREELYARWHDYEDSGGSVWKNERLGIVIRGNTPISSYPAKLTRVD